MNRAKAVSDENLRFIPKYPNLLFPIFLCVKILLGEINRTHCTEIVRFLSTDAYSLRIKQESGLVGRGEGD